MARSKQEDLTIFLMKEGTAWDDVYEPEAGATSHELTNVPFVRKAWTAKTPSHPPSWFSFVSDSIPTIENILVNSASCLIALETEGRIFCIPFGYARTWINDSKIQRRFGMIVTLNSVDPERVKSIDKEELEHISRITRSQLSIISSIDNFGIDITRDLLRSVTGDPLDKDFATHISGADSLHITCPIEFSDLASKCAAALERFVRTDYREKGFEWVDKFQRINDQAEIDRLDATLVEQINSGEMENIFLSPPNVVDFQQPQGFLFPGEREPRSIKRPDIRLEELITYLDATEKPFRQFSLQDLRKKKIRYFERDSHKPTRQFTVYDSIIFESRSENSLFILTQGDWYKVDGSYVDDVKSQILSIPEAPFELPPAIRNPREIEEAYNKRAAQQSGGTLACLDKKCVKYGGKYSKIEVCDLLSDTKHFVHVKIGTKSALLSHLFNQGVISAQLMLQSDFRLLAAAEAPQSHAHIFGDNYHPSTTSVVFGIITASQDEVAKALPFFSQQSLANARRVLKGLGYTVQLKKIPYTQT